MSKIKIIIIGSCVSRDPITFDNGEHFQLECYFARTSFAVLNGAPFQDQKVLNNIHSSWQRRMVKHDMQKSWLEEVRVKGKDVDLILVDLIDERFNLYKSHGSIGTLSSEYKRASGQAIDRINSNSPMKYALWEQGLKKFFMMLEKEGLIHKLVVNKVYYAKRTNLEIGCGVGRYAASDIKKENERLEAYYQTIKGLYPKISFLEYPEEVLIADESHRWGCSPFHYIRKAQEHQNNRLKLIAAFKKKYPVRHSFFETINLSLPINWKNNYVGNNQWMHHLLSLRWVKRGFDTTEVKMILNDYYRFHYKLNKKNNWQSTIRGDHTAALRLENVSIFKKQFEAVSDAKGVGLCNRILKEDILLLQSEHMYRYGHNHGLMTDIALLKIAVDDAKLSSLVDLNLVISRAEKTIKKLWTKNGVTKEHSVSYQEHNLLYTVEFYNLLSRLGLGKEFQPFIKKLKIETKRFLGFALRSNGDYFALGDTLRKPNLNIIKSVYFDSIPSENECNLLSDRSKELGAYCKDGFFFYRGMIDGVPLHFATTCNWHSNSHKQNDEFSFSLDFNGLSIVDDPGYSGVGGREILNNLKSEMHHSTLLINGVAWKDKKLSDGSSRILGFSTSESGFSVEMEHARIDKTIMRRTFLFKDKTLKVEDSIYSELQELEQYTVSQKVLFSPDLNVSILNDYEADLILGNDSICRVRSSYDCECFVDQIMVVGRSKSEFLKSSLFEFRSNILSFESNRLVRSFELDFRGNNVK
ncbi:DUF6270 domain-containing protein [Vreelandella sp. H-I2]